VLVKVRALLNDMAPSKEVTLEQSKSMGRLKEVAPLNMPAIMVTPCVFVKVMGLFSGVPANIDDREMTFVRSQFSEELKEVDRNMP